ncbi:MAG TPA: hypothetical protein VFH62_08565 [Dehalococcoidia bacterium]|nr:hypothetical protein [Dehalococcoidia bacterium]
MALVVGISAVAAGTARAGAVAQASESVVSRTPPFDAAPNRLTCEQVPLVCAPALGVSLLTLAAPAAAVIGAAFTALRRPLFELISAPHAAVVRVQTPPPRAA